ncbi:MAG: hypothetical protein V4671_07720 [Armatimonadota bacterium]
MTRAEFVSALAALPASVAVEPESEWTFKAEFLQQLMTRVPEILKTQDPATGQFGSGIWIVTDQNVLFPLAAAWSIKDSANPHYHDPALLEAIGRGGDALIAAQNPRGMWVFRKKDNSTWGDIYMPWTYSRWIRAYALVKEALPAERRARWEKALTLGFEGISATALKTLHNIPTHHAMGLYCAGAALNRPEWKTQASAYMKRIVATQDPGGFWSENLGPVVGYNFVYVDALGAYYGMSKDPVVLPALERAARFHASFTYPNGSAVETVDERQIYHSTVSMPGAGFSFSPEGRGYIRRQWGLIRARAKRAKKDPVLAADGAASFLLYGTEGSALPAPGEMKQRRFVLGKNDAAVDRQEPWFIALSAYHAPVPQSRWIQDRQNLVSLFHDSVGLIVGGGNTKLQPLWSTFTVGDTSLLFHKPGDENPDFTPPSGLFHTPAKATLEPEALALALRYGDADCRVSIKPVSDTKAILTYALVKPPSSAEQTVEAHLPLLPHRNTAWKIAHATGILDETPIKISVGEAGDFFEHNGWRITLPPGSSLSWPVLPHDPYKKDGKADPDEGRIVVSLPLTAERKSQEVSVLILPPAKEG